MTIPQFRRWLESKIAYLQSFPDEARNPDDHIHVQGLIDDAYRHAVDLRLPAVAAACKPGPVTVRLLECLNAIPEQEKDVYSLDDAAHRLGVSRRTVSRLIKNGDLDCRQIGRRVTITAAQLRAYQESAGSGMLFD
jgi:excisionase family DNA binding protein